MPGDDPIHKVKKTRQSFRAAIETLNARVRDLMVENEILKAANKALKKEAS